MKISNIILYAACAGLLAQACKPKVAEDKDLPAPSVASISSYKYFPADDEDYNNAYIFTDATPGGFISSWEFGGIKKSLKPYDTVFFAYAGTYLVKLISASKGGSAETSQEIVVPRTSPFAADFTVVPLDGDAHRFKVNITTPNTDTSTIVYSNGEVLADVLADTVYFPWEGTYVISVTTTTKKGTTKITSTKKDTVEVAEDDNANPDLTDPIFKLLTGGPEAKNGKTWVIFNANGVGALDQTIYDGTAEVGWYKNTGGIPGAEWQDGAAANEFTFNIRQYQFIPKNTKATIHFDAANQFFGKNQPQYADIALEDPALKQAPFIMRHNPNLYPPTKYSLTFTGGSYFGYHENRYYYEIVTIEEDTLYIRQPYSDNVKDNPANDGGARYFTYVKKK